MSLFSRESKLHWNELMEQCKGTYVGCSTNPYLGNGLFTCQKLEKGDFVTVYDGLRMTYNECDVLQRFGRPATYALSIPKGVVVDALGFPFGAAMANHSCNPNTRLRHGLLRGPDRAPYAYLEALKDISIGDELYTDYGYLDNLSNEDIEHILHHKKFIPCRCLQPGCRKVLFVLND